MRFMFGPEELEKHPLSTSQTGKYFFLFDELYKKMKSNATTVPQKESKTKPFSL